VQYISDFLIEFGGGFDLARSLIKHRRAPVPMLARSTRLCRRWALPLLALL
jgi:hypothetical protein